MYEYLLQIAQIFLLSQEQCALLNMTHHNLDISTNWYKLLCMRPFQEHNI